MPVSKNEDEIDNMKAALILVSFDDLSAPSEIRMFIFWLFHQFTAQLYIHTVLTLLTMD